MAKAVDLQEFTVAEYKGFTWQKWTGTGFDRSQEYKEGYQKQHSIKLASGDWLNLSNIEMEGLVFSAFRDGKSDIIGKTFTVTVKEGKPFTGKDGKEIKPKRCYFALAPEKAELEL